jgi:copper homeostasis protein
MMLPLNDNPPRILIEVCVGSVADANSAVAAGADRIELCAGLELGGMTPSWGLAEQVLETSAVPVVVMLRPRAGGFHYDKHEFSAMLRDGERFLELGASGLVFGILDKSGQLDVARSRELVRLADGRQTVFHRAFDFVRDQLGGKATAQAGAAAIREIVTHAAQRIEIMAGGGINADNVVEIVRRTGCAQVHVGASAPCHDSSISRQSSIELCDRRYLAGGSHRVVCGKALAATIAAMRSSSRTSHNIHGDLI